MKVLDKCGELGVEERCKLGIKVGEPQLAQERTAARGRTPLARHIAPTGWVDHAFDERPPSIEHVRVEAAQGDAGLGGKVSGRDVRVVRPSQRQIVIRQDVKQHGRGPPQLDGGSCNAGFHVGWAIGKRIKAPD